VPHPRRRTHLDRIRTLDPRIDAHAIYRTTALYEFPWEMVLGLNLAFYRTFAAPRIAAVVAGTGEMAHAPQKRANDTGLFMFELIEHGYDHPRGREVVRRLNRLHRGLGIANVDFVYVLGAFVVAPTRFVDESGWRPLCCHERAATYEFYAELGRRMNLRDVPPDYASFEEFFDAYEDEHLGYSPAGAALMAATQEILANRYPRVFAPLTGVLTGVLLDERLCRCLGVQRAPGWARHTWRAALRARGAVVRRRGPRQQSWFTPGVAVTGVYPDGYTLADLGPRDQDRSEL
jgi:uncharacterized protein (DUF2236 family)